VVGMALGRVFQGFLQKSTNNIKFLNNYINNYT
jgi:hypothetical protein